MNRTPRLIGYALMAVAAALALAQRRGAIDSIGPVPVEGSLEGLGMNVQVKKDGTIRIAPAPDTGDRPPRPPTQQ